MLLSQDIKPVSWVKNNTKEMIETVEQSGNPLVITQKGEAKVVVMDVKSYDMLTERLALLRMLSRSQAQVKVGRTRSADAVFDDCEKIIAAKRNVQS